MDIFSLLSYINKVSLLAFFVTTLVVGYQVYVLKKEKTKEQTPTIPDFKEKNNPHEVANFTSLPSSLTKKEFKKVNYSKLIFLIISLLTIMVVIFVFVLIKKNSSVQKEVAVNSKNAPSPTPIFKPKIILSLSPKAPTVGSTVALSPSPTIKPTVTLSPSPIVSLSPSAASSLPSSTCTGQTCLTSTVTPSPSSTNAPTSPSPTEIILAKTSTCTGQICLTPTQGITNSKPQVLPETGNIGKGLLIFGVAVSTIFFSFWF